MKYKGVEVNEEMKTTIINLFYDYYGVYGIKNIINIKENYKELENGIKIAGVETIERYDIKGIHLMQEYVLDEIILNNRK